MKQSDLLAGIQSTTGESLRMQLYTSLESINTALSTSYGPLGFDKIIIDESGDVLVSNDGATILKHFPVTDPFGLIVTQLAQSQDEEVGDGTTGVVLFSIDLIKQGLEMLKKGMHHSEIVKGYKNAYRMSIDILKRMSTKIHIDENVIRYYYESFLNNEDNENDNFKTILLLRNIVKTSITSKILNSNISFFSNLILDAIFTVYCGNERLRKSATNFLKNVRILKKEGGSMADSELIKGVLLNCKPSTTTKKIVNGNICILNFDLKKKTLPLSVKIKIENPEELEKVRKLETDLNLKRVNALIKAGADIFVTSRTVEDVYLNTLEKEKKIVIKYVSEEDIQFFKEALNISEIDGRDVDDLVEYFEENEDSHKVEDIQKFDVVKNFSKIDRTEIRKLNESFSVFFSIKGIATFLLRGGSRALIDEMHRSLHDSICVIYSALKSENILPAGGAVECAISIELQKYANLPILKFSDSILITLKTLLKNSGHDFYTKIPEIFMQQTQNGNNYGIDAYSGAVQDNIENGIVEPLNIRMRSLRAAVEAAVSVLRIETKILVPEVKVEKGGGCGDY